jgi:hypothetical protein
MRLLSFLTDIEKSVIAESPVVEGGSWQTTRMVNFHNGLARLTLTPRNDEYGQPTGTIFVQSFALADGSICLKASLNWKGSDAFPVMAVYSTPATNWKLEASKVASRWLEGAPAQATVTSLGQESHEALAPLAAMG